MQHVHNSISFLSICSLGGSTKCRKSPGLFCPRDQTYCKYDASGYVGIRGLNPVAKQQMVLNLPWVWEKNWTYSNIQSQPTPLLSSKKQRWRNRVANQTSPHLQLQSPPAFIGWSFPSQNNLRVAFVNASLAQGHLIGLPISWSSLVHFFGLLSKQTSLLMWMIHKVGNKVMCSEFSEPGRLGLI